MAKFYGIGTGPGNADLVTVRGVNVLKKIAILYTPEAKKASKSLALQIVAPYLEATVEIKQRHFPMVNNSVVKEQAWQQIATEILQDVTSGRDVGFVTLGDPMIYSTYSYLLALLKDKIPTETIPGISSFCNIANTLQLPLVREEEAYTVLPATADAHLIELSLEHFSTIVLMKVSLVFPKIRQIIVEHDLLNQAVLISHSSLATEEVHLGLAQVAADVKLSYFSTIIVYKNQKIA